MHAKTNGNGSRHTDADLWSSKRVAEYLGCAEITVKAWRRRSGMGPPFIRVTSGQVRYRPEDVEQWLQDRRVSTEVDSIKDVR